MNDERSTSWLRVARPSQDAAVTLVCFPWAGAGSAAFRGWHHHLGPDIEVCAVQLPGREDVRAERPRTSVVEVAGEVGPVLERSFDRPLALFGHSLGALLAFETARYLDQRGARRPVRLFVSGCEAPDYHGRRRRLRHTLSDAAFLQELRDLNGIPEVVLRDPDLIAFLLPTLRADFEMAETYEYVSGPPLDTPITAFRGSGDPEASADSMDGWRRQTSIAFREKTIDGDHFFVQRREAEVLRTVRDELAQSPV